MVKNPLIIDSLRGRVTLISASLVLSSASGKCFRDQGLIEFDVDVFRPHRTAGTGPYVRGAVEHGGLTKRFWILEKARLVDDIRMFCITAI